MSNALTCKKKLNPWFYIVLIIMLYFCTGFMQYKLNPVLVYLMKNMGVGTPEGGMLTSIPSLVALFATIPLALVLNKTGARKMGFIGMFVILISSLLGTFFLSSYPMQLLCQAIYGFGQAALSIVGPYVIVCLFAPEFRGKANGFYITSGTISQLVMYNLVPRIVTPTDLAPAWWFTTIFIVVMIVIWHIFLTDEVAPPAGKKSGEKQTLLNTLAALKNPKILQFFIGSVFFMCSAIAVLAFTPTYLAMSRGMEVAKAASLVSVCAIVGAFSTALGGWLSDILHTRKWIYIIAILWMAISRVLLVVLPMGLALNITIWLQGIPSVAMGLFYTASADVIEGKDYAMCCAAISTGTKLGSFFAASIFGVLVAAVGFSTSYIIYAVITLGALIGVGTVKGIK